ncbi:hypothetical protein J6590_100205 [Homalodisca vitripennis]|nr:hypothetical protein J6590_100205 [Homalodisca vitripennis]
MHFLFKSSSTRSKSENHHQQQDAVPRMMKNLFTSTTGFDLGRPSSLLPVSIWFNEQVRRTRCFSRRRLHWIPYHEDKDNDVFWASNSTEQDVQLAVGKTVSAKLDSDKIDCLTLALVTGHHRTCHRLTSPDK